MAAATRWAVVKSGLRRVRRTMGMADRSKPVSRSTTPPEAMRPAVGTPRVTEEPEPPEAETAPAPEPAPEPKAASADPALDEMRRQMDEMRAQIERLAGAGK